MKESSFTSTTGYGGAISRNVVVWSALISGYVREGDAEQALSCLKQMQHDGILPNTVTYICALNACASINAAEKGKKIQDEIARQGLLQKRHCIGYIYNLW
ncbi:hypothetical protein L7F22_027382 [Adiantum nelumboides]|nr:hypothetical protein [Adiantum nelumboides]